MSADAGHVSSTGTIHSSAEELAESLRGGLFATFAFLQPEAAPTAPDAPPPTRIDVTEIAAELPSPPVLPVARPQPATPTPPSSVEPAPLPAPALPSRPADVMNLEGQLARLRRVGQAFHEPR